MLVAVESWVARDHAAEWKEWVARCDYIADRVVEDSRRDRHGAAGARREPQQSQPARDAAVGFAQARDHRRGGRRSLDKGEPRIAAGGGGGGGGRRQTQGDASISITSAMMAPATRRSSPSGSCEMLSAKHTLKPAAAPRRRSRTCRDAGMSRFSTLRAAATHILHLQQNGNRLEGTHQGNFLARDIAGTISGDTVALASVVTERHGDALTYRFSGKVDGRYAQWFARHGRVPGGDVDRASFLTFVGRGQSR